MKRLPALIIVVVCVLAVASAGCARAKNSPVGNLPEATATTEPTAALAPQPAATPEAAVVAYLGIVRKAYYSLDSTLVAPYVTADQWVREDAYIQLNLTQNQAIEMQLLSFSVTAQPAASAEASSVTLDTDEKWNWRYWDLKTRKPKTEWVETGYSVRYTLVRQGTGWLVDGTQILEQSGEMTPTPVP